MNTIKVSLPENRWHLGWLWVESDTGVTLLDRVAADGRADSTEAAKHTNPTCDPTKPFGNTPCGEYMGTVRWIEDTPENRHSYGTPLANGKIPAIHLQPLEGDFDSWKRQLTEGKSVDMGLMIHAGDLNPAGQMRPTHGCVRIEPGVPGKLAALFDGFPSFRVSIFKQDQPLPT